MTERERTELRLVARALDVTEQCKSNLVTIFEEVADDWDNDISTQLHHAAMDVDRAYMRLLALLALSDEQIRKSISEKVDELKRLSNQGK
jgi:hypothetical protein